MDGILRTDASNPHFKALVALLDADLAKRDGADNVFYTQFNGIDTLPYCVVYFKGTQPLGCGAIKRFDRHSVEVKRMFVQSNARGKGIATKVLTALETWAKELGYTHCVLETGKRQPEAIALYKKNDYKVIPNYPPYEGMHNSVCFKKEV
ncbi:GNAT family N-acetyltransferase [Maribacter sp. CXY002]|uniref:GNAT family N-acetyltransferase n=1 Tax=Maribacter luteocoastalis TaxID=3407671 RepID=UPI003B67C131